MQKKYSVPGSAALACVLLALPACAGSGQLGGSNQQVSIVDQTALAPPTDEDLVISRRPYLIGPYDRLIIDVFGMEGLQEKEVQADGGGRISFPLAGSIDAAGKTTNELGQEIEARLRQSFVRDPQVSVNLKEAISQVVTVDGQVKEPGLYPVIGKMTLMKAVATAKGTGEFAKLDDVVVFRTVGGQRYAALYNLGAIRRGAYVDPEIYANDIVMVGDSKSLRLFDKVLQLVPLLTTPLVVALQSP